MAERHTTFCRICESLCGLEIDVEENRVVDIRPDSAHVATQGFACPKGLKQHKLYDSPDRLLKPRKRTADGWRDVGWDEALSSIGGQLAQIKRDHGGEAIAMYVGTAAGFGVLHPVFAQGFMDAMGSGNMYSSASQDCANKFAVAQRMYGFPFTQPFPDLLNTQCLIIVGANPMVSKWSFLQVPNPRKHINGIKDRGGRVIVVDPRRTETAKAAGEHHFIRPNSDVYFYLAFLQELIRIDALNATVIEQHTEGFASLCDLAKEWSAERSARYTGIAAQDLRDMVAAYAAADGACLYSSTGVNMGAHGGLAFYLQEVINAVSGNLDRTGGTLVGRGIIDFARFGKKYGLLVKEGRSRIGGFKKTNDTFPGGILADEILTAGPGKVRALIVTGGNPLLTMADGGRLQEAFSELELLVTLDIQPTETASAGHYMLPCTAPLERPDLPFIFPLMLGMQVRPYLQATQPVLDAPGETRDEATIYTDLASAAGASLFGSRIFQTLVRLSKKRRANKQGQAESYPSVAQRGLLNVILRLCGQTGFRGLLGHGVARKPHAAGDFLGQRVYTNDDGTGRINLAPSELIMQLGELVNCAQDDATIPQKASPGSYHLITKRQVETHNSWTHNLTDFLDRLGQRNFVFMHPDDAQREGFSEGDLVDVIAPAGRIRLPASFSADLLPGVIAVPHGWGHQGSGQKTARESAGVNVNLLAQSGVANVDPVTGMSHLTGIAVRLEAASAAVAPNWSGVEPESA